MRSSRADLAQRVYEPTTHHDIISRTQTRHDRAADATGSAARPPNQGALRHHRRQIRPRTVQRNETRNSAWLRSARCQRPRRVLTHPRARIVQGFDQHIVDIDGRHRSQRVQRTHRDDRITISDGANQGPDVDRRCHRRSHAEMLRKPQPGHDIWLGGQVEQHAPHPEVVDAAAVTDDREAPVRSRHKRSCPTTIPSWYRLAAARMPASDMRLAAVWRSSWGCQCP